MRQRSVPAAIIRGGTSKGVFLRRDALPPPGPARDSLILEILGSGDPMQIDGLGGTHSSTSKVMAVGRSVRDGIDIDYLFAQGAIERKAVDYGGNCGNLTAAVGGYAIDEGLVEAVEPVTTLRLYNENTGKVIVAHVPVNDGAAAVAGDTRIAGVPGTGAAVRNEYLAPAGAVFGRLFPTGSPRDVLHVAGVGRLEASIVDVTNPLVFVRAADVGLRGDEHPDEVNADAGVLRRLEAVRAACAVELGLVDAAESAAEVTPGLPKLAFLAPPSTYRTVSGELIGDAKIDLLARMMSMQRLHHAYAMTGVMCTVAAARLPGTLARELAGGDDEVVRIGHPKGVAEARVVLGEHGEEPSVRSVSVVRTARRLMSGMAHVRTPSPSIAEAGTSGTVGATR